jgi:hypothetical protein
MGCDEPIIVNPHPTNAPPVSSTPLVNRQPSNGSMKTVESIDNHDNPFEFSGSNEEVQVADVFFRADDERTEDDNNMMESLMHLSTSMMITLRRSPSNPIPTMLWITTMIEFLMHQSTPTTYPHPSLPTYVRS